METETSAADVARWPLAKPNRRHRPRCARQGISGGANYLVVSSAFRHRLWSVWRSIGSVEARSAPPGADLASKHRVASRSHECCRCCDEDEHAQRSKAVDVVSRSPALYELTDSLGCMEAAFS